jgi:hypothetical protein
VILANNADTLILPDDLVWVNELEWSPVMAVDNRSISGKVNRQTSIKQGGRLISLRSYDGNSWVRRSTLLTLRAWAENPSAVMALTFKSGESHPVIFVYQESGLKLKATQAKKFSNGQPDEWYRLDELDFITTV